MAKKEEVAVAESNAPATVNVEGKILNTAQLLTQLRKAKQGDAITKDYWKPEAGETYRAVFVGMAEMNEFNGTEQKDAIKLLIDDESDGKIVINADKVLISLFRELKAPAAVLIECTGEKQGKNGSYRTFNVFNLNI